MTCIIGIEHQGRVWMGGDRAAIADSHYAANVAQSKVFQRGPFLIGYTSSFRMGQLLQYKLRVPAPTEDLDEYMVTEFVEAARTCLKKGGWLKSENGRERGGEFLVGIKGRLYSIDDDFNALRNIHGFTAVGCGISVAKGSLHTSGRFEINPAERIRMALEAASIFTTGVRPPFDILVEA